MTWLRIFVSRFLGLFRKSRLEQELDEEVRTHLQMLTQENQRKGMSPEAARYAAMRQFGNVGAIKEECREAWGIRFLSELAQDVRYGLRQLRRNPGFTVVAILTLALGIGATTAIFSMVNGILLKSLPYHDAQQLYIVNESVPQLSRFFGPSLPVNSGNFLLWQRRCTAFSGMAELQGTTFNLTGRGIPRQLQGVRVSANFFSLMGIRPQLGRTFLPQEEQVKHDYEVILAHSLWRQAFNSDPGIIGQAVDLNGESYIVVGVLPANFRFPKVSSLAPQVFKPLVLQKWDLEPGIGNFNYTAIARLKRGVSPRQALAQLNTIEAQIAHKGDSGRGAAAGQFDLHAVLRPLKTVVVGPTQRALWMLMVAAAFVLAIICVNLANLTLVKNAGRVHEVAVRTALGATPRRLARQFLTEAVILAAAGGALGLLVADWGLQFLVRNAPVGIPRVDDIRMDHQVLGFTLGISLIAGLIFSVLPALRLSRVRPMQRSKSGGRTASARLRGGLVMGQIALCGVLLAGALLLIRSLAHVVRQNSWLEQKRVVTVHLILNPNHYRDPAQRDKFFSDVLEKVEALPGVASAGFVNRLPLSGHAYGNTINFREVPRPKSDWVVGDFRFVSPGYFNALGLPVINGRLLSRSDRGKDVAVISESTAGRALSGRDPIGMHLVWQGKLCRIIGVVGDVRAGPDKPPVLAVYLPVWLSSAYGETLVVRAATDSRAVAAAIPRVVWGVDPQVAIPSEQTLKTMVQNSEAPRRYETLLGALFALCAVLIAALGLYGVISHSVSQRTHEIGIRMALGAQKNDVLKMVVGQGLKLGLIGVAIGIAGALALTRFLASLLYGVTPTDPLTFIVVSLILIAVALVACYIPARRAAKVDPMVALRYE